MTKNIDFSHLSSSDITFIDALYEKYRTNPSEVDLSWQRFFQGFEFQSASFGSSLGSLDAITDVALKKEINVLLNQNKINEQLSNYISYQQSLLENPVIFELISSYLIDQREAGNMVVILQK